MTNFADEQRDELTTAVKLLTRQIESLTEKLDEVGLAIENQPSAFSAELGMLADDETVMAIRAIARELDLDRKTVRRCLRQSAWRPYQRAAREDTLLAPHAPYVRQRAAEVGYSARVLFQELRRRRYEGNYETVKRFVRPLRATSCGRR